MNPSVSVRPMPLPHYPGERIDGRLARVVKAPPEAKRSRDRIRLRAPLAAKGHARNAGAAPDLAYANTVSAAGTESAANSWKEVCRSPGAFQIEVCPGGVASSSPTWTERARGCRSGWSNRPSMSRREPPMHRHWSSHRVETNH